MFEREETPYGPGGEAGSDEGKEEGEGEGEGKGKGEGEELLVSGLSPALTVWDTVLRDTELLRFSVSLAPPHSPHFPLLVLSFSPPVQVREPPTCGVEMTEMGQIPAQVSSERSCGCYRSLWKCSFSHQSWLVNW